MSTSKHEFVVVHIQHDVRIQTSASVLHDPQGSSSVNMLALLNYELLIVSEKYFHQILYNTIIFISNLSDDRSTASSKTIPPLSAI
jgi:hypothetical protein